jgi:hypothetical protein
MGTSVSAVVARDSYIILFNCRGRFELFMIGSSMKTSPERRLHTHQVGQAGHNIALF